MRQYLRSLLLLFLGIVASGGTQAVDTPITHLTLGIFAYRPKPIIEARYQPLVDYLNSQLKESRIELQVLELSEIEEALSRNQLDLIFTNPRHYILLRSRYKLSGAIATLVKQGKSGHTTHNLGGVIFTGSGRDDIDQLADIKGQWIAIPGTKYLGGYQTQAYELMQADIRLPDDAQLFEMGRHDAVVEAVLAGRADVGFVRTEVLEDLSQSGKLDLAQIKVLNRQNLPGFPFVSSTRLYPEWPFITLPHVDQRTVSRIASALLALEADHLTARAVGIAGFAPPADYLPVEKVARALRLPPYDHAPDFTLWDVWEQHKTEVILLLLLLVSVSYLSWLLARRNQKLIRQQGVAKQYSDRIRHIIDATQVGTWEWNVQTGDAIFNERWAEMLGYSLAELSPLSIQTWIDLTHPDDVKATQEILQHHFAGETDYYEADFRMKHKAGHWIWIHDRGQVIEWAADGSPLWMSGTHTDVTARKQTSEELKRLHLEQSIILDNVSVGIAFVKDQKFVWTNHRVDALTGYRMDELVGTSPGKYYWSPRDFRRNNVRAYPILAQGETYQGEWQMKHKDGSLVLALLTATAVNPADLSEGVIWLVEDITERKYKDEQLRKLSRAVEQSHSTIVITDLDANIEFVNPAFTRTTGYTREEALGQNPRILQSGLQDAAFYQTIWDALTASKEWQGELHNKRKDGSLYWEFAAISPVKDEAGKTTHYVAVKENITARKEAEQALKESEERLDMAMSVANDGIWDCDPGNNTVIFDSRYYTMAGYEPNEFPYELEEWEKRVHPDDIRHTQSAVRQHLEGAREVFDVEFRFRRKDGDYMWIRGKGKIVARDEKGNPARFVGTHSDINERKQAELALQESQRKHQRLLDNIGNKFVIYSYNKVTDELAYVSAGVDSLFGLSKEEMLGKSWTKQIRWLTEDLAMDHLYSKQQAEGKADFLQYEMRHIHPDGGERTIRISSHPVRDETGNLLSIDGILEDITEQKAAQEQLRLAASVFDYSQDSIIITDANNRMVDVNPACLKVTGYSREELLGNNPHLFSAGTHSAGFYRKIWKALSSGKLWRGTFNNQRKDGTLCLEEAAISPIKGSRGEITHYVSVKRDVTSQKAHEKALRRAKQAAQAANVAKSEFLANMSHEIRTPMNAILGFTELCLEGDLAPQYKTYLTNVRDSSNTMLVLINDILDFSKIEAGKLELESIPFDLDEELTFVLAMMQETARKKHVELQLSQAYDGPTRLLGDPLRLKQVLINLTGNAIKFTDHGKVIISVNELERTEALVRLEFSVCDTGIGLSTEDQENLFSPFWQGDSSTTRKFEGTGLGLAISNRLVSGMGGMLEVESEKGEGSLFYFRIAFPLIDDEKKPSPEIQRKQHTLEHISGARILLVEDNEINQQLATALLERHHLCVETACNGQDAIDKLDANQYDLVLMDIQMPVMDGYEATRKIRKDRRFDDLPIIALTANAMPEIRDKCLQAGMNDYITKPLNLRELLNKIECLLKPGEQIESIVPADPARDWSESSHLTNLPGIDAIEAVKRLDIDTWDYIDLLKKIALHHRNDPKELKKLILQEDWEGACSVAHTLKGLAGTAGANELSRFLLMLEQALQKLAEVTGSGGLQKTVAKESVIPDNLNTLISDMEEELNNIVSVINKLPIKEEPLSHKRAAGVKEVKHRLKELLELSKEYNASAIGKLEALLLVVTDAQTMEQLKDIQKYCEDYDFDVAAKSLETLLVSMDQQTS